MLRVSLPVLALLMGLLVTAHAVPGERVPSPRRPGIFASDRRLAAPVSLTVREIYLGELLDDLAAQTGVLLEVDDRLGPISGYSLAVVVHERPAREVLEAAARLFSAPPDRWYWEPRRRNGTTAYILRNTLPPVAIADARRTAAEQAVLAERRLLAEFYASPAPRRAEMARLNPRLEVLDKPEWFEKYRGQFAFVADLPDEKLLEVMRGKPLDFPLDQLTPAQRRYLEGEVEQHNRLNPSIPLHVEELKPQLYGRQGDSGDPGILLNRGGFLGAHTTLGGHLEADLADGAARAWRQGDEAARAHDQPFPDEGVRARSEELRIQDSSLDTLMLRIATLGRINLLLDRATHVMGGTWTRPEPLGPKLADALALATDRRAVWKRWGELYLVRPNAWPAARRDAVVPWPVIRETRASARKNDGYLTADDVLRLSGLSQDQLYEVGREFPDAGWLWNFFPLLRAVAVMNAKERQAAARPEGARWGDFTELTRARLAQRYGPETARTVRVLFQWESLPRPGKMRLGMNAPDWKFQRPNGELGTIERQLERRRDPEEADAPRPVRPPPRP